MHLNIDDGIAWIRMDWGKVNAIGPAFLDALNVRLDELESSEHHALVLTGNGRLFSAGLDLPALYPMDRVDMRAFLRSFTDCFLRVFAHERPVVALAPGHAIAGGCVLMQQADWRMMVDSPKPRIGLNELSLGIGLPLVVTETLRYQTSSTQALALAGKAALHAPQQALGLGLLDQVVQAEDLEATAQRWAKEMVGPSSQAYAQVKRTIRGPTIAAIEANRVAEGERWLDTWFSEQGRSQVGAVIERLRQNSGERAGGQKS